MTRKPFTYLVRLMRQDNGEVVDYPFVTFWKRHHHGVTDDLIGTSAAAQAHVESRKTINYAPMSVEEVTA